MCGICGIINTDGRSADSGLLQKMTDSIAHRGPDSSAIMIDHNIGLGHCRLAIIDPSEAGKQPMTCNSGRYTIVYNGEVYNYQELRKELEQTGRRFSSHTDTEVVLAAYEYWGEVAVERFNGMFALAIYDKELRTLFLARDRYGIKPLYLGFSDKRFYFASEQKAILADKGFQRQIDCEALFEYFTFQNLFTNKTLLKNIQLFPAGCYATLNSRCSESISPKSIRTVQYWDFDFHPHEKNNGSENELAEELVFLFKRAVKRQLVSDVGISSYLSGGMDSGAITAIASRYIPYIRTFTCGFDLTSASGLELNFDERESSEQMSYLFKTEHYEMVLKAGDMERILPRLAWHLEEPRVGQSYPNFYMAMLAGKFDKVVLAGTGGDEIFGGYPWRYYRAAVNTDFDDYIDKYYTFWQRLLPNGEIQNVCRPIWDEVKHVNPRRIFRSVFRNHDRYLNSYEDYINHSLYFEAKTFLHGLLIVEDKLSMANSLETRVPFLDNDLVDFAMRLPVQFKLGNLQEVIRLNENDLGPKVEKYYQRTRDGKLILRKAMERFIPKEITQKVKQGFSAPDASWFRGESIDYVKKVVFDDNSRLYEYLDAGAVRNQVNKHLEGKENKRLFIWSLLNFEQWLQHYI